MLNLLRNLFRIDTPKQSQAPNQPPPSHKETRTVGGPAPVIGLSTTALSKPQTEPQTLSHGSWERKQSPARHCIQVIFKGSKPVPAQPIVEHQLINAPLMLCTWGLCPVKLAESEPMDLYAKASGVATQLKPLPCKFAFAFYAFPESAILQFFLEIQHDPGNPFVVECACDLAHTEMKQAFQEIIAQDAITLHFLNHDMSPAHSRQITKSPEAKSWMSELWQAALNHDQAIPRSVRDYQLALQRYNAANPMDQSPII